VKEKKTWEKEFESGRGSSCLISVEKMMKNETKQRKKEERKRIIREGALTVGRMAWPNAIKFLTNIKVQCCLHKSLHISLHCNQILKLFMENGP
jgi:hypothetical protein